MRYGLLLLHHYCLKKLFDIFLIFLLFNLFKSILLISSENIFKWGLNPLILLINSVLKPFITDITTIKTATPNGFLKMKKQKLYL